MEVKCKHCEEMISPHDLAHVKELSAHDGLCCDCFDLSWGMPLDKLNSERARKGKGPINKPWPDGNNLNP